MPILEHRDRRGPGEFIMVGDTRYELNERGQVDVSAAHAVKMLQGALWRSPGYWAEHAAQAQQATPPVSQNGGRRVRTAEELAALVASETAAVSTPARTPIVVNATADLVIKSASDVAGTSPAEEEIEITPDMSRADLLQVAKRIGVKVPRAATRDEVYAILQAQGE